MRSAREEVWSAYAEAMLMGHTIKVQSEEHLRFIINYVAEVLRTRLDVDEELVFENATNKYNSEDLKVSYVTINSSAFGVLMTFVRDDENNLTSDEGVLCWVENLSAPDCSELGYCYFKKQRGAIRRIA